MISERLKEILKILSEYRMHIIQNDTLASQEPEETIQNVRITLANDGDIIEDYLRWRTVPSTDKQELIDCINSLSKQVDPWNIHVSSLAPEWCRLMFKDYPLTLSPEHIARLYKNSGITDGDE
jgi:hypothetical protein